MSRYPQLRKYTKELLATSEFQATKANEPLLKALALLNDLNEAGRRSIPKLAPTAFVTGKWEEHVFQEEGIDRHAYELCALSELRSGLRSGDIWIAGSRQHKALEDYLLSDAAWQQHKQAGTTEVTIPADFPTYLAERKEELHRQLTTVEQLLKEEKLPDVRLVKGELVITPLVKAVPDEVDALTRQAYDLLPRIKLPDLLLEVDTWAPYSRHFTHLQTGDPPKDRTALFAALLADAINLGLTKMAEACAGMTFNRLAWVVDWHVRDETYTKALAEIINYHHRVPFAAYWGDGTTSSSDGQRDTRGRKTRGHRTSQSALWNGTRCNLLHTPIGSVWSLSRESDQFDRSRCSPYDRRPPLPRDRPADPRTLFRYLGLYGSGFWHGTLAGLPLCSTYS